MCAVTFRLGSGILTTVLLSLLFATFSRCFTEPYHQTPLLFYFPPTALDRALSLFGASFIALLRVYSYYSGRSLSSLLLQLISVNQHQAIWFRLSYSVKKTSVTRSLDGKLILLLMWLLLLFTTVHNLLHPHFLFFFFVFQQQFCYLIILSHLLFQIFSNFPWNPLLLDDSFLVKKIAFYAALLDTFWSSLIHFSLLLISILLSIYIF